METLSMDIFLLTIIFIIGFAITLAATMVIFRLNKNNEVNSLSERLIQLTESHAISQTQITQQLQIQERALAKSLEEKLVMTAARVSETLEKNTNSQKSSLDELKERLIRIDAAQKNITDLSSQMIGLQDILSNKQARGAFGEVQLENLVTSVLPPGNYKFQITLSNGKRADCLLDLPQPPGPIIIDAKFPLESYRLLRSATSDEEKKSASRAFASDIMKHVNDISEKYILPGETADAALMFLPSEAVYAELHGNFPDVVDKTYLAKVFVVSPTTLWATLNTIRAVLKDVNMKESAGIIQKEILTMMTDVQRLDKRVANLQRHFDQAGEDMREVRTSTEKITKRGDRIQDLEIGNTSNSDSSLISTFPIQKPD
jgi:DNA recombination protein RmuC